jgi:cephalosporin hydroxylase
VRNLLPGKTGFNSSGVASVNKAIRAVKQPSLALQYATDNLLKCFVAASNVVRVGFSKQPRSLSGLKSFDEIVERSMLKTDISDHLTTLFLESLALSPSLIVELGVRGGESTFVLERVAEMFDSILISVDIEDCLRVSGYSSWYFVKDDDITFAERFPGWCRERNIRPSVDVLLIDTSHEFNHTLQELRCWVPFLSGRSKLFMHDTNMKKLFSRKDGSMGFAWDNNRGVIGALEAYLGERFDEEQDFTAFAGSWMVRHYANCCGFTVLERLVARATGPKPGLVDGCAVLTSEEQNVAKSRSEPVDRLQTSSSSAVVSVP